MAPELLNLLENTTASDVYAMVCAGLIGLGLTGASPDLHHDNCDLNLCNLLAGVRE